MLVALGTLVLAVLVAACGGNGEDGQDRPAAGSGKGGSLTIYSGREEELVAPLFKRYEREAGTKLKIRYGDSAELAATIIEEGHRSPADLYFGQDAGALGALQKEGLLAKLPDDVLDRVEERFRSTKGEWVGTSGRVRVVAYDKRKLKPAELPKSILDFTDPSWKGRIGWVPTNASFQSFVTALRVLKGEDAAREWLEGIVANEPKVFEKNSAARDAVAAGEVDVAFINHYYVAQAIEEEGSDYPVGIFNPPGGDIGSLVNVAGIGILESSDRREAALAFLRHVLSADGQRYFAETEKEYPLVEGVEADPSLVAFDRIEQPEIDLSDLDDLKGTLDLIEKSGAL